MRRLALIAILALAACSTTGGPYPSLRPRAAEAIDPRAPVVSPMNNRPVTPALAAHLAELTAEARAGDAQFEPAAAEAEHLAASAGAAEGESWIAAQQALTAAIAARKRTTTALGDIDATGATLLQLHGGIAPNDLAAIRAASGMVAAIDQRQAARISAIQRRLGL